VDTHGRTAGAQRMARPVTDPYVAPARLYGDLVELWPLVSPPEDYVEEVATFRALLERHGVHDGARLLHLGCGGGSIDHHLRAHYAVTGIDLSAGMLAHARRLNPDVDYRTGDMRSWRSDDAFDAVLVHDAIAFMTTTAELDAVYRTAAAHLRPGGVLIALPEELRPRLEHGGGSVETHGDASRSVTLVEIAFDDDPSDTRYEVASLFVIREHGEMRIEVDRHTEGVFELDEFVGAVRAAGFDASVEDWPLSTWQPGELPLPLIVGVLRG
jgi:SAM-dependent methyltransferase